MCAVRSFWRRRVVRSIPVLALLSCGLCGSAFAMMPRLNVEQITSQATLVIEGRITDTRGEWSADHTYIHTWVSVAVSAVHKGRYTDTTLKLRVLGGVADGIGMSVDEGVSFAAGEHVILFLGPNPHAYEPTIGRSQGVFRISDDAPGATDVATNGAGVSLGRSELVRRVAGVAGKKGGSR